MTYFDMQAYEYDYLSYGVIGSNHSDKLLLNYNMKRSIDDINMWVKVVVHHGKFTMANSVSHG